MIMFCRQIRCLAVKVDPERTVGEAAKLLQVGQPAAAVGASIVTLYGIVVKGSAERSLLGHPVSLKMYDIPI